MPRARPDGRGARQDPAAREVHRGPWHAPSRGRRRDDGHRRRAHRGPVLRLHQPDRPRHAPAPRPGHGAHRAVGHRPDGAGHPRLLRPRRPADPVRAALGAQARVRPLRRGGLAARRGARARVLPRRAQRRPRRAAEAADRAQRPQRDVAPDVLDRRRQRVRPAVRGRLRLLQQDGPRRRHADPRDRRRADGDQLLPRPPAAACRRGVLLQAAAARDGAAPRHVRHLHGQANRRRAGQRDARAPEPHRQGDRAQPVQQPRRQRERLLPLVHRRAAALRAGVHGAVRALRQQLPAADALHRGADQHPVGHRQPHGGHPQPGRAAAEPAHRKPRDRRRREPLRGAGRHARLRLARHPEAHRAHARVQGRRVSGRLPAAAQPERRAREAAPRRGSGRGPRRGVRDDLHRGQGDRVRRHLLLHV